MKKVIFLIVIIIASIVGWIRCIVKACNCNWEPIGKAEIAYTIGSLVPPAGAIIGYIDIQDK